MFLFKIKFFSNKKPTFFFFLNFFLGSRSYIYSGGSGNASNQGLTNSNVSNSNIRLNYTPTTTQSTETQQQNSSTSIGYSISNTTTLSTTKTVTTNDLTIKDSQEAPNLKPENEANFSNK